ncbi:MAG: HPr kinase/phosphatase C-terminal domain-containing protein, partial [Rhodospirillaceae bacterium]
PLRRPSSRAGPVTAAHDAPSLHATCIAFGDAGVLLRGPSGAGKSDFALRLIQAGASLVADDRVRLRRDGASVRASAPPGIAGRLEIRGAGLARMACRGDAALVLVADLVPPSVLQRLPDPAWCEYLGVRIRSVTIAPFESSSVAKLRIAAYSAAGREDPMTGARIVRQDED